ncbi:MAG: ABC transporter permease [Pseudomonadota bacterium]
MPSPSPTVLQPREGVNRRFATMRSVLALILREMATRYGRSPGGYIWAVIEPMAAIVILSIGFSLLLHAPSLGTSFILFYATGYLPFNLYQIITQMVGGCISFSRPLLHYPAVTWADAAIARFILNALTGILVMILLLTIIVIVTESRLVLDLVPILVSVSLALLLGFGFGMMNAALMGLFPVWAQFWGIVSRPLFLMSGVFYIYEDLPQLAGSLLWYNPLIHVVGLMREGFYPTYTPNYIDVPYVVATGLIPLFFGVVLMGKYHRDILNNP